MGKTRRFNKRDGSFTVAGEDGRIVGNVSKAVTGPTPMTYVEAMLGRAGSGAAGTHGDRRTKRQRTRAAQKRAAIDEG